MYETKKRIRQDRAALQAEVTGLKARLAEETGHVGTLTADQQALADAVWNERVLSRSGFQLRMTLVTMGLAATACLAAAFIWVQSGVLAGILLGGPLATVFVWLFVKAFINAKNGFGVFGNTVRLPSGQIVTVSPAQVADTEYVLRQMADA